MGHHSQFSDLPYEEKLFTRQIFTIVANKFAKSNPREKCTSSQFEKFNLREKKISFFCFSELAKLIFLH